MTKVAWAPTHSTLFFSVPKNYDKIEEKGSIGVGFNYDKGVKTRVELNKNGDNVFWNGDIIDGVVSKTVLNKFREYNNQNDEVKVNIYHTSEVPIGYGLSTSGAGAIGTIMALDNYFKTNMSQVEQFEIAHFGDVVNKTGLGSVVGQITGGIEFRLTQGGPRLCKTRSIESDQEIILFLINPIKTADILKSDEQIEQINRSGFDLLKKALTLKTSYEEKLIIMGKDFSVRSGLLSMKLNLILKDLENIGEVNSTMSMIGETIVILPKNKKNVLDYAISNDIPFLVTKITNRLPHLMDIV